MTSDFQKQLDRIEAKLDRIIEAQEDARSSTDRQEDTRIRQVLSSDQLAALHRVVMHYQSISDAPAMTASEINERAGIPQDLGRVRAVSRYLRNRQRLVERRTGERREFIFHSNDS